MEEEEKNRRLKLEERKRKEEEKLEKQRLKVPGSAGYKKNSNVNVRSSKRHYTIFRITPLKSANLQSIEFALAASHQQAVIKQIHNLKKLPRKHPIVLKMAKMNEFHPSGKVHSLDYDQGYLEVVKAL